MNQLPTFNRYTVDIRLSEFRRVSADGLEVIPFTSDAGRRLIDELYALYREVDLALFAAELHESCA
jgi:hypothetical protein